MFFSSILWEELVVNHAIGTLMKFEGKFVKLRCPVVIDFINLMFPSSLAVGPWIMLVRVS